MMSGSLKLCRWALAAAAFLLVSEPAFAEKRVSLVFSNSAYRNVAPLTNAVIDSVRIAATLKDAVFDVVEFPPHLLPATDAALRAYPLKLILPRYYIALFFQSSLTLFYQPFQPCTSLPIHSTTPSAAKYRFYSQSILSFISFTN